MPPQLALGALLAVAPVTARNYAVSGERILISSHGGLNLYIGNNAEADGTYHSIPGITPNIDGQARDAQRVVEQALGRPVSASDVSAYFYAQAWGWIAAHPADAARLLLRKLAYALNATELTLNHSYRFYSRDEPTLLRYLFVGPWLLVPLGLVGLAAARHRSPAFRVWAAFVPLYTLSVALFFVSARYRMPLLVPLCVGAAVALDTVIRAVHEMRPRRLLALLAGLALLATLANWDFGLDDALGNEQAAMIEHLIAEGRDSEARERLARAQPDHPQPGVLLYRVGRAYQAKGQRPEAIAAYERALKLDPGQPEIRLSLGQALLDTGRAAGAVPHLRAAFEAGVRRDLAGFDLARALAASGQPEAARAVLAALGDLDLDPDSALAVTRLALDLGAPDLALHFVDAAGHTAPSRADLIEQRGIALALLGRGSDALAAFESAQRLEPGRASLYLNAAVLHAQAGRLREARAAARRALAIRPDYPQARALLDRVGG